MNHLATFDSWYTELLWRLVDSAPVGYVTEINTRTGSEVRILPGAVSKTLGLEDELLPLCGRRRTYPVSAAAEMAWFLMGERNVTWLNVYSGIWKKFTESDKRTVTNAYGYRWRHHFHRDQLGLLVDRLQKEPSDRRTYIGTWDPGRDGLGTPDVNVPCPVGFTVHIIGGKLHMTVLMRSLDVFVGLPYDVMGFSLLCGILATSLNCELGTLTITAAHAHLYQAHYEMAEKTLTEQRRIPSISIPRWPLADVRTDPDAYVEVLRRQQVKAVWSAYAPKPEVIE